MGRSGSCCCNLPYVAVASTVLASAGLAVWWQFFHQAYNHADDALKTLGVSYPQLSNFKRNATGYLIITCVDLVLLLLLALWRSSILCRRDSDGFSAAPLFRFLGGIMASVNFAVVVWVVVNLMALGAAATTMGLGYFAAQTTANALGKFDGAADLLNQAKSVLDAYDSVKATGMIPAGAADPIETAVDKLRPYVNVANGTCAPFCLDLNSFKFLDMNKRCICDGAVLKKAANMSKEGAKSGVGALVGGMLLLVGLLWLLMNICGQVGGACSDIWHEDRREEYEVPKPVQFQTA